MSFKRDEEKIQTNQKLSLFHTKILTQNPHTTVI